jgi:putative ABC transport system permease protein
MSNLTLLVDSAASDRVNLLITFQSPTLYTAIQRAPKVPKIFTLLQNPFILGAGKSDADHLPNLTGMYLVPPFDDLTTAAGASTPPLSVLGTVFFAGSEDSVYRKDELVRIAHEKRIEVIAEPYSSTDEIPSAIDILLSKNPKAVVHLQDPAQDVTFPVLYQRASSRKIPVLSVVYNMEKLGATLVYTTDRDEVGKKFAAMVSRIIKGADPSTIPFENDRDLPKRVGFSRAAADAAGVKLPASVIGQATASN